MKLTSIPKFGLLAATLWPPVYISIVFPATFANAFYSGESRASLFTIHGTTFLILFLLIVIYAVHMYMNDKLEGNDKMLWLGGFLILGMVVMPMGAFHMSWTYRSGRSPDRARCSHADRWLGLYLSHMTCTPDMGVGHMSQMLIRTICGICDGHMS